MTTRARVLTAVVGSVVLMLTVSTLLFRAEVQRIRDEKARRATVLGEVTDFKLVDATGAPFSRADMRDRVWVVHFFYTGCETDCDVLAQRMARLSADYDGVDRVGFLSITVDPARDTVDAVERFRARYGGSGDWVMLTGEPARVTDLVTNGFRAAVRREGTRIVHGTRLALVDRQGRIRGNVDGLREDYVAAIRPAVKRLLAEN